MEVKNTGISIRWFRLTDGRAVMAVAGPRGSGYFDIYYKDGRGPRLEYNRDVPHIAREIHETAPWPEFINPNDVPTGVDLGECVIGRQYTVRCADNKRRAIARRDTTGDYQFVLFAADSSNSPVFYDLRRNGRVRIEVNRGAAAEKYNVVALYGPVGGPEKDGPMPVVRKQYPNDAGCQFVRPWVAVVAFAVGLFLGLAACFVEGMN